MDPVMFQLGPLQITSFGLMTALGFIVTTFAAANFGRRQGIAAEQVMEVSVYVMIAALMAARLGYVLADIGYYVNHTDDIFQFTSGGLLFYPGLIGALLALWVYGKRHDIPFWRLADVLAAPVPLGLAIAAVGSNVPGYPTAVPWAVVVQGVAVHPQQLYAILGEYLIFAYLWTRRRQPKFEGQLFLLFFTADAVVRFVIEGLRVSLILGPLSVEQWLSLAAVGGGSYLYGIMSRRGTSRYIIHGHRQNLSLARRLSRTGLWLLGWMGISGLFLARLR